MLINRFLLLVFKISVNYTQITTNKLKERRVIKKIIY